MGVVSVCVASVMGHNWNHCNHEIFCIYITIMNHQCCFIEYINTFQIKVKCITRSNAQICKGEIKQREIFRHCTKLLGCRMVCAY